MVSARQLGRRSSIAVLAITAIAVVMLMLLVVQTSRLLDDEALLSAIGQQRLLGERVAMRAIAAQLAPPAERAEWLREHAAAAGQLRAASAPALPSGAPHHRALREIADRERRLLLLADRVAEGGTPSDRDTLVAEQRAVAAAAEGVVTAVEAEAARRVDRLVRLEALCVVLLLAVLVLVLRLALRPAQQRLEAAVQALSEEESRTRTMLDAMREGMLLVDAEGRLLAWNPSAARMLGIPPTGPLRVTDFPRLVDETGTRLPMERMPSQQAIRTGTPQREVILGFLGDDGQVARWMEVTTRPLRRDGAAAPYAAVVIFRDVTDERQAEEERAAQAQAMEMQNEELMQQADALGRGEALFRSLVDTAGSAIVGLDMYGRVFEWNRESEQLFGITRADAMGRDYADDFVPESHRARMREGITRVLGGETLRNHTGPVRGPGVERRTVIWNITPLRASPSQPVHGLIAAGIDITEREASDARFRALFERSTDAHLLLDDHGVIDCNDATLRLLRCDSKAQLVGRSMADISPKRQPDGRLSVVVGSQMRQLARDRGYHRFEWYHQRADGSEFPVEITLTPVRLNGRDVILSVWHDIAERKAVESALRAAKDAAESANRTKSDFMTRMNHELRTPLTAIIGFSRVLLQGKQGALSEGAQRYTDRIRANGMHLLSLINQILDVAKVEAGRMELEPERVEVDALVREIGQMLESTADMKGIALRHELSTPLTTVVTDATKLRQILINLVGNAIKFTEQGEVCIRVEADPRTFRPVSITIRDTGIGIPLDRQQKVFEPFEQGDSSTRREYGGTGLGLSIVKAFAELIGAAIEVESEVGKGTSFTIWLSPTDLELPRR